MTATSRKPSSLTVEHWETISFVPVTGWTNHFTAIDGSPIATPCPGVLVQELRGITRHESTGVPENNPYVTSTYEAASAPLDTRAIAADLEYGHLIPVDDVGNFHETTIGATK